MFYPDPHTTPESPKDIQPILLRVDEARSPCRSLAIDDTRFAALQVLVSKAACMVSLASRE
jgi:hypothetical protein